MDGMDEMDIMDNVDGVDSVDEVDARILTARRLNARCSAPATPAGVEIAGWGGETECGGARLACRSPEKL